jgi:hypothetical protein
MAVINHPAAVSFLEVGSVEGKRLLSTPIVARMVEMGSVATARLGPLVARLRHLSR